MWVSGRTDKRKKKPTTQRSKKMFNNSISIEQMATDINRERARNAKRDRMWQRARNAIKRRASK
jgi:hypothetical protein